MNISLEQIDSIAFGQNVLKLTDINENINFSEFEKDYINKYNPRYVYTKISTDDISKIHYLESNGFEFIECQIELFKRLTGLYDTSMFDETVCVEQVTNVKDLDIIYQVSDSAFNNIDRIYVDEKLDNSIAQKRYHLYLKDSFEQKNQRLDKLVNIKLKKIIGFHSLLYKDEKSVMLLLGGILPEYQSSGLNYALDYHIYNDLFKSGHKNITTHISAKNTKVMNYLTKVLGFKFKHSFIVMRKIYD